MNPHQVTRELEKTLCEYTGAKYAVAVTSCTAALHLCLEYFKPETVEIPKRTYVSVPMQIKIAGAQVRFRDEEWLGGYQLKPIPVYDYARRFTSGMYVSGQFQCVSFHTSKVLADTQGGAILHNSPEADEWFRRARFDGRAEGVAPKDDTFNQLGWHCYMSPDVAARLLWKLSVLPKHNDDLPNSDYPDLSTIPLFRS